MAGINIQIAIILSISIVFSMTTSVQESNDFLITLKTVNTHDSGRVTLTVTNNGSETGLNITLNEKDTEISGLKALNVKLPFNIDTMDEQIALSWTSSAEKPSKLDSIGIVSIDFTSKDSKGKEVTKSFKGHCYAHVWKRTLLTTTCCCRSPLFN